MPMPLVYYIVSVWKRAFSLFGWIYNQVSLCLVPGMRAGSDSPVNVYFKQHREAEWVRGSVLGFWDIVSGNSALEIIKNES